MLERHSFCPHQLADPLGNTASPHSLVVGYRCRLRYGEVCVSARVDTRGIATPAEHHHRHTERLEECCALAVAYFINSDLIRVIFALERPLPAIV